MKEKYKYLLVGLFLIGAILFVPYEADCYMFVEGGSLIFEVNATRELQQVGSMKITQTCENEKNLFDYIKSKFVKKNLLLEIEIYDLYNEGNGLHFSDGGRSS